MTNLPADHLVVGQTYEVPCVRSTWPYGDGITEPYWVPVLGPPHDDTEIIGLTAHHYHVDHRFLTDTERSYVSGYSYDRTHPAAYSLVVSAVWPENLAHVPNQCLKGIVSDSPVALRTLPNDMFLLETYYRPMQRVYTGPWPAYPHAMMMWAEDLARAYSDMALDSRMVCPHRGTDLRGIEPVNGVLTCPLHGLRWCAETGKSVPLPKDFIDIPSRTEAL